MKRRTKTNKALLQAIATRTPLLLVFAVSLATSGLVLSANANERKTAIITFDVPGAAHGPFQGTLGLAISPEGIISRAHLIPMVTMPTCGLATAPSSMS